MSQKVKHVGLNNYRLRREPLEKVFAEEWEKMAPTTLGYLLCGQEREYHDYTPRDAEVAATIIQWLGSPVGSSFVESVMDEFAKKNKEVGVKN